MARIKKTDEVTVVIEDLSVHPTKQVGFKVLSGVASIDEAIKKSITGIDKIKDYRGKTLSFWLLVKPSNESIHRKVKV